MTGLRTSPCLAGVEMWRELWLGNHDSLSVSAMILSSFFDIAIHKSL